MNAVLGSVCCQFFLTIIREKYLKIFPLLEWAKNKELIIWGCGRWGKFIHALLVLRGFKVKCFTDSNSSLWGKNIQGNFVIPFNKITNIKRYHFIVAVKNDYKEIMKYICSYGVPSDSLYYHPIEVDTDLFYSYSLN